MTGNVCLIISLIAGVVSVITYVQAAFGKHSRNSIARYALTVSGLGIILASAVLLLKILRHDFSVAYVWSYSSHDLPLHFLLSTFYAGQEGSFLFWAFCSALLSFFLLRYTRLRKLDSFVLPVYMTVQSFLLLLLIAKSPFKSLADAFPGELAVGQVPSDGRGLNPLLQNIWMVIHPPVLFVGFAAMTIPFSFAMAALWRREYKSWLTSAFPWVLFATLALGAGLMLGAYWAYGVLGWGGYWGWDPVENSSLIPWIVSMALLHTMLVQQRTGKMMRTNFILSILSFIFVLYSTFLTRSGVLGDSSVHSFTDPGSTVYILLLIFLSAFTLFGIFMLILRRKELKEHATPMHWLTREFAMTIGSFALIASAVVVFFGTSLPLFSVTRVEPSFYDMMNLPIAILIGVLIGYSLLVRWEQEDGSMLRYKSWKSITASVVIALVVRYFGDADVMTTLFAMASAFTLAVNTEIAYMTIRGDFRMMGGKIAHIGLAIFFFGVLTTGKFSQKENTVLELNVPKKMFGYTLTYTGHRPFEKGKTAFDVAVQRDGKSATLSPVMFEAQEQGVMRNPDIISYLTRDLYLSPVSLETPATVPENTVTIVKGGTVKLGNVQAKFVRFDMDKHSMEGISEGGMPIGAVLELSSGYEKETITPVVIFAKGNTEYQPVHSKLVGAPVQLVSINVGGMDGGTSSIQVAVVDNNGSAGKKEALVVDVSIKPFISLLWTGTVLLFIGIIISIIRRRREDTTRIE